MHLSQRNEDSVECDGILFQSLLGGCSKEWWCLPLCCSCIEANFLKMFPPTVEGTYAWTLWLENKDAYRTLAGGFRYFLMFIPTSGDDPIWQLFFSDGLKPPTRKSLEEGFWQIFGSMLTCFFLRKWMYTCFFNRKSGPRKLNSGWWFQIFFIFIPIWGRFPSWLIFFG